MPRDTQAGQEQVSVKNTFAGLDSRTFSEARDVTLK